MNTTVHPFPYCTLFTLQVPPLDIPDIPPAPADTPPGGLPGRLPGDDLPGMRRGLPGACASRKPLR